MGEVATTGWEEVVLLVVVVRDKGSRGVSADTWLPRRDLVPLEVKVGSLPFGAIRRWFVRSGLQRWGGEAPRYQPLVTSYDTTFELCCSLQ